MPGKGSAARGERPIGAARCRQQHNTVHANPPPPTMSQALLSLSLPLCRPLSVAGSLLSFCLCLGLHFFPFLILWARLRQWTWTWTWTWGGVQVEVELEVARRSPGTIELLSVRSGSWGRQGHPRPQDGLALPLRPHLGFELGTARPAL